MAQRKDARGGSPRRRSDIERRLSRALFCYLELADTGDAPTPEEFAARYGDQAQAVLGRIQGALEARLGDLEGRTA
jgi:hypothetical protein